MSSKAEPVLILQTESQSDWPLSDPKGSAPGSLPSPRLSLLERDGVASVVYCSTGTSQPPERVHSVDSASLLMREQGGGEATASIGQDG
jgi:hypothetical protein